ncbi:CaiB/BaiF CoA transferase family protein [Dasania marina]|uniref:CaiB/BaiF CoA transferase family protein n=1 Tax=Dasania marina TaxID=471499 RepID=UPI00038283ED|nr:CaiB/BaiF CoA-transferase family protein [Dasania marina]
MSLPLEGLLVVALEQAVAAPYCSSRLADAGARVIKVERAEGDFARGYDHVAHGESAYFVWVNRGKESLCLNIKDEKDRGLLQAIILEADVFIQNLAPGAASRAGFDSKELRETNEKLITVDISGYGESGPYQYMKAYDLLVQCESGLASITGAAEQPGRVGVSICDIACGMYAHAAVLEALVERQQTGLGKGLSVSLFDAIADWLAVPLMHQDYAGKAPERVGLNHPSIAPYGAYHCLSEEPVVGGEKKDGPQVVISIQSNREWKNFCEIVLEKPGLVEDPLYRDNVDRCLHRPALDEVINSVFSKLTKSQLIERLNKGKIAFGSLNSIADLSEHQQLRRTQVDTPTGPVSFVAPPVIASNQALTLRAVPALGEHTDAIKQEFNQ